jgi:uncharacterized protein (UPF0332 family)
VSQKEIRELPAKARRSGNAAEVLLNQYYCDFAASREYHATFYAAQSILLTRDVRRNRHSGIIAALNEMFVRTGQLPQEMFLSLREAFQERAEGDYGLSTVAEEQARSAISQSRKFIAEIEAKAIELLKHLDPDDRSSVS